MTSDAVRQRLAEVDRMIADIRQRNHAWYDREMAEPTAKYETWKKANPHRPQHVLRRAEERFQRIQREAYWIMVHSQQRMIDAVSGQRTAILLEWQRHRYRLAKAADPTAPVPPLYDPELNQ